MNGANRLLLIGFGRIGQEYARALRLLNIDFVVQVTDFPSESTRRAFSEFPDIEFSSEVLIREGEFSRAILAVPPDANLQVTRSLLEKGIGKILYEKPGALSLGQLIETSNLLSAAQATGWIAYNRRCYPTVLEAKTRIESDGGVSSVVLDFTELWHQVIVSGFSSSELRRWILYNASHLFDLVFFATQRQPKEVSVVRDGFLEMHPAGAAFSGSGLLLGGGLFTFFADWNSKSRWWVEFRTSERSLLLKPLEKLFETRSHFDSWKEVTGAPDEFGIKLGLIGMIRAFMNEDLTILKSIEDQALLIEFLSTAFYSQR